MYGVIITSRPTCQVTETIDHVDCIPTCAEASTAAIMIKAPAGTSKKWPVIAFTLTIVFALMAAIMPDRKTVYMVAGVETINRFSQTEVAKELGESGMNIVRDITTMIHTYTMDAVRESKEKNGGNDGRN